MADPVFSVVIVTAAPTGMAVEAGGAFVKIDGREVLLKSVELFLNRDNVKQIQVAFEPDFLEEGRRKYGGHFGFSGVKTIGAGPRWIDQLAAAAEKLSDDATHVLVHDAARPAVSYLDLEAIMEAAAKHPAAALATPLRAPLIEVDEGGNALAYHAPQTFMHLVTPQVFSKEKFHELVKDKKDFHASQFTLIKGSPLNVRCGGGGDVSLVKAMLHMLPKPKIKAPLSPFDEAQW
ncbi:hypothetical protein BH09PLA1_BH09PLA1_12920 [soil metagenome]